MVLGSSVATQVPFCLGGCRFRGAALQEACEKQDDDADPEAEEREQHATALGHEGLGMSTADQDCRGDARADPTLAARLTPADGLDRMSPASGSTVGSAVVGAVENRVTA
jgi:hypothetical protein